MAAGTLTLTLTCLSLVACQAPADLWPTNQRNLKIPVDIQPARRQEIRELILYVSTDKGQTWQQECVVPPDKDGFPFYAPRDGEYWFRVAARNHQGKQEPENVYQGPPHQKVLIDTLKPGLRLVPQRQGEEIQVQWEIQEDYPDLGSLKLFYRQGDMPTSPWLPASLSPALVGKTSLRAPGPGAVSLRLEIKDVAGNLSFAQTELPPPAGLTPAGFTPEGAPPAPGQGVPPPVPPPAAVPPPAVVPPPASSPPSAAPTQQVIAERVPIPADGGVGGFPAGTAFPRPVHTPDPAPGFEVVASSKSAPAPVTPPPAPEPPAGAALPRSLPPLQVLNNTELIMEYELAKVGPSGIGKVELFLTRDEGQTWVRFAEDPEVESVGKGGPARRTVRLPGEGVYGFYLVALSKAGRGKRSPQAGDLPEMRVEVDLTPPEVDLARPVPDPERHNSLLLRWACKDRNLAPNGVTLEWAEQRDGNWQTIAANLPNTGRHSWQLPPGLPVYIYLRVRVRDTAANEGVAVTAEPQLADLSEPVGRLLAVTPTPRQP